MLIPFHTIGNPEFLFLHRNIETMNMEGALGQTLLYFVSLPVVLPGMEAKMQKFPHNRRAEHHGYTCGHTEEPFRPDVAPIKNFSRKFQKFSESQVEG